MNQPRNKVLEHRCRLHRLTAKIVVLVISLVLARSTTAQQYTSIPSPRADGKQAWIVDTTGKISQEAIEHVNALGDEILRKVNKEVTVVVIGTTGGPTLATYGTQLFNHWGVGKWGFGSQFRNDGILLIVAMEDRWAEIILGKGIDDDRKIRTAQQIVDDIVVPYCAAGDPSSGVYEGMRTCATRLLAVSELDSPDQLPSVSARGGGIRARIRQLPRRGFFAWWAWAWPWALGFGLIGGVISIVSGRYYLRYRSRKCPKCELQMVLLKEDDDDRYLLDPEIVEERLGSVDYDVWACRNCNEVQKIRYGRLFTRYSRCPQCWYITVYRIESVLMPATYSHGGRVRVVEECHSCNYQRSYTYQTPRRVRVNSSSGGRSGGWSSGGMGGWSGGRGGGSGFGGGSSSGRSAGGGW